MQKSPRNGAHLNRDQPRDRRPSYEASSYFSSVDSPIVKASNTIRALRHLFMNDSTTCGHPLNGTTQSPLHSLDCLYAVLHRRIYVTVSIPMDATGIRANAPEYRTEISNKRNGPSVTLRYLRTTSDALPLPYFSLKVAGASVKYSFQDQDFVRSLSNKFGT